MLNRRYFTPPPSAGLPSGFTSLDYITISSLNQRVCRDSMVGASDVVYLDHQFEAVPTWSSSTNPEDLFLWSDTYRDMYVSYIGSFGSPYYPVYSYTPYEVGFVNALESSVLTTERVLLCMPNSAYSVNGVIYPSNDLSAMRINDGVTTVSGGHGEIQSVRYRIYGCYILDVFDWRHYMVPCLRVSDRREGLYDLVDGVFTAILEPNAISLSILDRELTSTYPVASDLTVVISTRTSPSITITFPKGLSSIYVNNSSLRTIESITPAFDDTYFYTID